MLNVKCLSCDKSIKTTWFAEILNPACQNITCFHCGAIHQLKFPYIYAIINGLFFAGTLMLLAKADPSIIYQLLRLIFATFVSISINPLVIFSLGRWGLVNNKYSDFPGINKITLINYSATFIFAIAVAFSCLWFALLYRNLIASIGSEGLNGASNPIEHFQHELKTKILISLITAVIALIIAKITWYIRSVKITKQINKF